MALDLTGLGKVAGIGGIALGAVVLLVRPLIEQALPGLDPAARAQAVQVIAIGAFALGGLGILSWVAGKTTGPSVRTGGDRSPGIVAGRDVSLGGERATGKSAAGPKRAARRDQDGPPAGRVVTKGDDSSGIVAARDVTGVSRPRDKGPSA
jgi:hypothetical protein